MNPIQSQLAAVRELGDQMFAEAHSWRSEVEGGSVGSSQTAETGRRGSDRPTGNGRRWGERVRREKVKFVPPKARKGEVRMTEFKRREAMRCGVSMAVIYERVMAGKYPGINIRRPHCKFVFVKPPPILPGDLNVPKDCELPLKVFVAMEAARLRTTERAVYVRIYRGKYPGLEFRRVNRRVVFVRPAARVGDDAKEARENEEGRKE